MFTNNRFFEDVINGKCSSVILNGRKYELSGASKIIRDPGCTLFDFSNRQIKISLEFVLGPESFSLAVSFENYGKKSVRIGNISIFSLDGKHDRIKNGSQRITFNFQDTIADNYVRKITDSSGRHWSKPLCLIHDPDRARNFFAAQLTFEKNNVIFNSQFDPANGRLQSIRCTMPVNNYSLIPGSRVSTDKIVMINGTKDPFKLLERWADSVHDIYQPEIPTKSFAGITGITLIDRQAELPQYKTTRCIHGVKRRLNGFGIEYCWISINNLKDGLPGNWLSSNQENFPDGVKAMLDEISNCGMKPGFWVGPFYVTEGSLDYEKLKKAFIRDKEGNIARRGKWLWAYHAREDAIPQLSALDPAHGESLAYVKKVFKAYAKWGIRYYMLDFLSSGMYRPGERSSGFCNEAYLKFMRKIKEFNAPDTHRLSAVGSTLSFIGAVSSSRIGMDYCEGRSLQPRFPSYPANYVVNGSFGSSGAPNRNAVNNLACWYFAHNRFFQCNSNMMTVGKPIPLNEARITASLFGISPSPVMFGDDIDRISEERLALIKKVLPRGENMPVPVDLFTKTDVDRDFVRIFMLPVEKPWGKWYICAIFNLNDRCREVKLDAGLLQLERNRSYRMYDFWRESYCGTFKNVKTVEVPGNSCSIFRLEAVRKHPWILSTDMHVRQGDLELDDVHWDEEKLELSGVAKRPVGETGNLYLIAPEGYIERNFNRDLIVAKSALDNSLIINKQLIFEQELENWKIEFALI